ncbi:MAG TPA: glycosyltransferase, partial [bacterium]|nr:glycosyltransferase [bacterium]
ILVDDLSEDSTLQKLKDLSKKYPENWIKIFSLDKNYGPAKARNLAWDMSKGDYIAFLDADDIWSPKKIEITDKILSMNKKINLLGHGHALKQSDLCNSDNVGPCRLKKISFFDLLIKNRFVTPSAVLRRDIKERFDEKMYYLEDHELWVRIAYKHSGVYFLNSVLVALGRVPLTKGGLSGNKAKMRFGEIKMYIKLFKYNPLFIFIIPILLFYSISKHAFRSLVTRS